MLAERAVPATPILGRVLAAAWRAALSAVADGADPEQARVAVEALDVCVPKRR
jgi:hypothetical protein